MRGRFWNVVFWLAVLAVRTYAVEESIASKCLSTLYKLQNPTVDTAIELEMATDSAVLSLFTTRSGRIGDFFEGQGLPESLLSKFPSFQDHQIREIPWNGLSLSQKMGVLGAVSKRKPTPFFLDRKIPHLRYVEELPLINDRTTEFLGAILQPGRQKLQVGSFLKGPIEYIGPNNDPSGVELHFRTDLPAGEVSRYAREFQKILKTETTHQHAYVVVPIPQKALEQTPKLTALYNADFFRRVNLAAEMITIVEEGASITKRESMNQGELVRWFGWLDRYDLQAVYNYLLARGESKATQLGDEVKIAWVGFRGHDKFDQPDLMGMEVRSIGRNSQMEILEPFLNTLQKSWTDQALGLSPQKLQEWLNIHYGGNALLALHQNWYHQDWSDILRKMPISVHRAVDDWGPMERNLFLESAPEETKMLFHDWTQDPLFFSMPTRQHILIREQAAALESLRNGKKAYREVVRNFLIKSGLYERVLRSLKPQSVEQVP